MAWQPLRNQNGPAIPTHFGTDLGNGVRYEWNGTGHLKTDVLPGFTEDLFPGIGITSFTRTREGVFYAVVEYGKIHRLDPEDTLARLSVQVIGAGEVTGIPQGYVRKGTEVMLTAIPRGRFSVFDRWSDGFKEPTRTLRLDGNTALNAEFVIQAPGPSGISAGTARLFSGNRALRFEIFGDALGYRYALEQSRDLQHWEPLPESPLVLSGTVSGSPGQLTCTTPNAHLAIPVNETGLFLRARLLP